jgi:hypothetical protein
MKTQSQLLWACFASVCVFVAPLASATIPDTERQALVDLYNATDGDNWIDNTNWLGPVGTECTWFGVTCDATEEHVVEVSLPDNNLIGTLAASIGQLEALEILYLNSNRLTGPIPAAIGQLGSLTTIQLSDNSLSGVIPEFVGSHPDLGFSAEYNYLEGPVPESLGSLTAVLLSYNPIAEEVNQVLNKLIDVQYLLLGATGLTGTIGPWVLSIAESPNMGLGANHLGQPSSEVADWLGHNSLWPVQLGPALDVVVSPVTGSSVRIDWNTEYPHWPDPFDYYWSYLEFQIGPTVAGPFKTIDLTTKNPDTGWIIGGIPPGETVHLRVLSHHVRESFSGEAYVRPDPFASPPVPVNLQSASGGWYHVAVDGDDDDTCTTPEDPCATIQSAIDRAEPWSTIAVGPGNYPENLVVDTSLFIVGSGRDATVIDGTQSGRVVEADGEIHVAMRDLRLTNGYDDNGHSPYGGGLYSGATSFVGVGLRIDHNSSVSLYGGAFLPGASTLFDVIVDHNTAGMVGGLHTRGMVIDSLIADNSATESHCGGIQTDHAVLLRTKILRNSAHQEGGGGCGFASVYHSTIAENTAENGGGWNHTFGLWFTNTTIAANHATASGGALTTTAGVHILQNCSVMSNTCGGDSCGSLSGDSYFFTGTVLTDNSPSNCSPSIIIIDESRWNLSDDSSCGFSARHGWDDVDARLTPFSLVGDEPSLPHPRPGSPLIDATGRNKRIELRDQTGLQAPIDGNGDGTPERDIGAVEFDPTVFANGFEDGTMDAWLVGPGRR